MRSTTACGLTCVFTVAQLIAAGKRDAMGCEPVAAEDFTGEWIADLKLVKIEPVAEGGVQLKLVFAGEDVRVFRKGDPDWVEVKPVHSR